MNKSFLIIEEINCNNNRIYFKYHTNYGIKYISNLTLQELCDVMFKGIDYIMAHWYDYVKFNCNCN